MNNITTKKSGKPASELNMQIGQYVKYEPSGGSTTYSSDYNHNGNSAQTRTRENLNWRILSVSGNTVTIISDPTSETVTYRGAEGYNNAVKDLNDMCQTLYSHGTTYARSVNLDDFTKSSFKSNFKLVNLSYSVNRNYTKFPTIYQYEYNGSLKQSEQNQWYSGTYNNTNFKESSWSGNIPSDSPLYNSGFYWLSSRSCNCGSSTIAWFDLQKANYYLTTDGVFSSMNDDYKAAFPVRTVATFPTSCKYKTNGDASSSSTAYDIIW